MWYSIIAADAPNGVHLAGDKNEIYWGTAAFVVLMIVLVRKAGPAIMKGLRGRTERIQAQLDDARSEREEAELALQAKTADTPDLAETEDRILVEAHQTAAKLKADMIERATAEAEAIRVRGRQDIENQNKQALAEVRGEFARMTRGAAEAIVVDGLDDGAQGNLIDAYINQVDQLA